MRTRHEDCPKFARRVATAGCKVDLSRARLLNRNHPTQPLLFGTDKRLYMITEVMDDQGMIQDVLVTVPVEIENHDG